MVAVPLTVTPERSTVVDFSPSVIGDGIGIIMKTPKSGGPEYIKVFSPFHAQ